jgi:hypothetical protein
MDAIWTPPVGARIAGLKQQRETVENASCVDQAAHVLAPLRAAPPILEKPMSDSR